MRAPGQPSKLSTDEWRAIQRTFPKSLPPLDPTDKEALPRGMKPERVRVALERARAEPRTPRELLEEIRRHLLAEAADRRAALRVLSNDYPEERCRLERQAVEFETLAQSRVSQKELQQFVILRAWQTGLGSMWYNSQAGTGAVIDFFIVAYPIVYDGALPPARSTATRAVIKYKRLHFDRLGGSGGVIKAEAKVLHAVQIAQEFFDAIERGGPGSFGRDPARDFQVGDFVRLTAPDGRELIKIKQIFRLDAATVWFEDLPQ